MNIVAISGSLRKASNNTALLRAAQKLAPDMHIEILDIGSIPVFNQDLEETNFPQVVHDLRTKISAADGVLIAVPEFNRTPAGSLKNFLDWSSRPESEPNPWNGKPVGILGASSGARGAVLAQFDVRRIMSYWNARTMGQPEFYLGDDAEKFDAELNLTDERTIKALQRFMSAFHAHAQSARGA